MKRFLTACFLFMLMANVYASPETDRLALREFFAQRFPDLDLNEMINGLYAFDEGAREQWLEMEDFPPYEIAIEEGEEIFNTPFANGKGYADCFENGGIGIKQNYPRFDADSGEVITLEYAINQCRTDNGEEPLPWMTDELAAISAYMAYTSRGNKMSVVIPDDPRALQAYESGKEYYYTRRGQLEFACENCHMQSAGSLLRADRLSGMLGQATHWPVYRSKWGEIGTLHKRFRECNEQVRAKPYDAQSQVYRELEYFLSYMSNGLEMNGPASRR
ncbi:MAG: sulfur oxidation c-type cytochrome SoxA [Lysobacterales bacterium]